MVQKLSSLNLPVDINMTRVGDYPVGQVLVLIFKCLDSQFDSNLRHLRQVQDIIAQTVSSRSNNSLALLIAHLLPSITKHPASSYPIRPVM